MPHHKGAGAPSWGVYVYGGSASRMVEIGRYKIDGTKGERGKRFKINTLRARLTAPCFRAPVSAPRLLGLNPCVV